MEGLAINDIPHTLLARILVQLHILPPKDTPDVMNVLAAGLRIYGKTSELNAFLDFCSTQAADKSSTPWLWTNYEINNDLDWDLANSKKPQELVGLRFLLSSETARKNVQLTRYGRNTVLDPKCVYYYQDRILPVDDILNDTLEYLKQEHEKSEEIDKVVEQLIELRLEQYSRDKFKFQQESNELDDTTYHLMGALMTRYDSLVSHSSKSWCLYLRDYTKGDDGSSWRVMFEYGENVASSDQALADIQGIPNEISSISPSESSKDYRPVTLFYINQAQLFPPVPLAEEEVNGGEQHITLDDYTFDDDYNFDYLDLQEQPPTLTQEEWEEICMHCQTKDPHDGNDMFICDNCNRGVHQLCEDPPVQDYEKLLDPWYCRSCTNQMKTAALLSDTKEENDSADTNLAGPSTAALPLPFKEKESTESSSLPPHQQHLLPTKRKREDELEQQDGKQVD